MIPINPNNCNWRHLVNSPSICEHTTTFLTKKHLEKGFNNQSFVVCFWWILITWIDLVSVPT